MKHNLLVALGLSLALLAMPAFGQHIHELYYNNAVWADTDLTVVTGGPVVYPQGITAFYTTPNDQLHVYYVSNNNLDFHIHQLYYNGSSWSDQDLTNLTGGSPAANSSGMSGFSIGNAQYVYFCDGFSVHEYSYGNNNNWNWVDTTLPASGLGCAIEGLVAFVTHPNNQRHVYYQAPAFQGFFPPANIRELYFNGVTWSNENLTAVTKGARAIDSPMSGFSIGNAQYVFFESPNGHIHEYSYSSANGWSWKDQDLTVKAGGTPAGKFSVGTASFVVPGTTKMRVYYAAATNDDVHQMKFLNNAWTDTDLSALTSSSGPIGLSQMVVFATTPNNQVHLYLDERDLINQLYYNGLSWSDELLPSVDVSNIGGPSQMAGFALGNLQHVYYISQN